MPKTFWFRHWVACVLPFTVVALAVVSHAQVEIAAIPADTAKNPYFRLSKTDRAVMAMLRVEGKERVTVLSVTPMGGAGQVAVSLAKNGCAVKIVAREIGYIRCVAPLHKLDALLTLPGIEHMALSATQLSTVYNIDPAAADKEKKHPVDESIPIPNRFMPRDNPFTASAAMQALSFKGRFPMYDGRGTAVGVIENNIDLLTPELRWARDSNGNAVARLVDYTLTGDWFLPDPAMPGWMYTSFLTGNEAFQVKRPIYAIKTVAVEAAGRGRVTFLQQAYSVPDTSVRLGWRMGRFDITGYVHPSRGHFDTNRDGETNASDNYTILFDIASRRVWVDLDHDKDFRDETPLRDFSVAREFGVFGKDDPDTNARESRTFLVHLQPRGKDVWLGVSDGDHGDMVASVMAGSGFAGSHADGIAPGARIVLHAMVEGFTHTYIEILLRAFRDQRTDVVTFSGGDNIRPTDGSHIIDRLTSRMIDVYDKPLFVAAGNSGPAVGMLNSPSVAPKAFSIGAYTPPATWKANFGITPTTTETLAPYSATGPADNGGLKPELLGVTGTLAASTGFTKGDDKKVYYTPPSGYMISGGTSAATPAAAGTAALLISAAKSAGIPYDNARLRTALLSSAKFLPNIEARIQGNGVIQVADAWQALQKIADPAWQMIKIISDAPVKTQTSHRLAIPHRGVGIYEREGWAPGMAGKREIVFTRKNGSVKPLTYALKWKGDTHVFKSADTLTLPLNKPVPLSVDIRPTGPGATSAIVDLLDSETGLISHQVLNTVVVAHLLEKRNGYRVELAGKVHRPGSKNIFIAVQQGAQALRLKIQLKGGNAEPLLSVFDPGGRYFARVGGGFSEQRVKGGEIVRAFPNPEPGVWQVAINNGMADVRAHDDKAPAPLQPADYQLVASVLGMDVDLPTATVAAGSQVVVQAISRLADFKGLIRGLGLGGARIERTTLSNETEQKIYQLDVPAGTPRLEVTTGGVSDTEADVDLYLFDATGAVPYLANYSAGEGSNETVTILEPKQGKWLVVVDPYRLPDGPVGIDYRDTVYHSAFGQIKITDALVSESGRGHSATLTADIRARPAGHRVLLGAVAITDPDVYVQATQAGIGEDDRVSLPLGTRVFPIE